jgi:ribosomal protein S18 acetylase RimI-like enzyme
VSPVSRGTGIGEKLCKAVEVVSKSWGMNKIVLLVEEGNVPARKLYAKLGYELEHTREHSITLRPDLMTGKFQEIPCNMMILAKSLNSR